MKTTAVIAAAAGALCLLVTAYFYVVGVQLAILTAQTGGMVSADIHAWQLWTPATFSVVLLGISACSFYASRKRTSRDPAAASIDNRI